MLGVVTSPSHTTRPAVLPQETQLRKVTLLVIII